MISVHVDIVILLGSLLHSHMLLFPLVFVLVYITFRLHTVYNGLLALPYIASVSPSVIM